MPRREQAHLAVTLGPKHPMHSLLGGLDISATTVLPWVVYSPATYTCKHNAHVYHYQLHIAYDAALLGFLGMGPSDSA